MSNFKLLLIGLMVTSFGTLGVAWIKQIQQKHLNQAQLKRIEIEEISKTSTPESLQRARHQTLISLEMLEQTPVIPLIAEPSKTFQSERHQLSAKIEQIDQTLATLEQSTE